MITSVKRNGNITDNAVISMWKDDMSFEVLRSVLLKNRGMLCCIARAERDRTRAETTFRLSPKRTSPFKSVGASVQSTAGSRGVCISLSMLDRPRSEVA